MSGAACGIQPIYRRSVRSFDEWKLGSYSMAQHRGLDQDVARHARGDPTDDYHVYQLLTRPALTPEEELELAILIQRGNTARDELISSIVPRFERFVQGCDVTPLSSREILTAPLEAVEHQIIAHSKNGSGRATFATALVVDPMRDGRRPAAILHVGEVGDVYADLMRTSPKARPGVAPSDKDGSA